MTVPSIRAWGAQAQYSGSNSTVAKPAGTLSGDLLLAFLSIAGSGNLPWSARIPAGWTMVVDNDIGWFFGHLTGLAYRIAGGSEPSTYAFELGSGGIARIAAIQDAAASAPTATEQVNVSSSATINIPSITTTVADSLLVLLYQGYDGSADPFAEPAGTTEILDYAWDGNYGAAIEARPTAGATGARTATQSNSNPSWGAAIVIEPAAGGGGSTGQAAMSRLIGLGGRNAYGNRR